jgi:hypothetical protein
MAHIAFVPGTNVIIINVISYHNFNIICYDKHHILYIVMKEATRFTSHMSWAATFFVREKPYSLVPPTSTALILKTKSVFDQSVFFLQFCVIAKVMMIHMKIYPDLATS